MKIMQAIILQIVGLLIITTLVALFFSKPNVKNIETKVYSKLILLDLTFILIGITTFVVAKLTGNITLIGVLQKIYMSILTILNLYSMHYCLAIYDKENKLDILKTILNIITLLAIIFIIILPLNVIFEGNLLDGNGWSYNVVIIHTIISFLFFFVITFYLILMKQSIKKVIPYIILMLLYVLGFIIRGFYKELIFEGFFYSFILFIMYNTIENPDVKIAKELSFQKSLAKSSSDKTLNLLNDISDELESSLLKLETFGNKKIDKNNIEELTNEISQFQNDSAKLSKKISNIIELAVVKSDKEMKEYKYETYNMLDKLKVLLKTENNNLIIDVDKNIYPVLYGDDNNIIRSVLYLYNFIISITNDESLKLKINSNQVGRFSRLRFQFQVNSSINQCIYEDKDKQFKFKKTENLNYQIIENILEKINGKIVIIKNKNNTIISLYVDQRIMTEYDIISKKQENRNIKINYNDYSNKRILIIDDSKVRMKEIKTLLRPYNVDVLTACTLEGMYRILLSDETIDLILIDDIIPHFKINDTTDEIIKSKDGVVSLIKKNTGYKITTVIMVTPSSNNMIRKYLNYGFDDYVLKPINKKNLDQILNKYFK